MSKEDWFVLGFVFYFLIAVIIDPAIIVWTVIVLAILTILFYFDRWIMD